MADIKIESKSIKLFPAKSRSDYYDRNAKMMSEQNLVSIVNRLTDRPAFVIDGLNVSENILNAGSCNIHGYLFNTTSIDISTIKGSSTGDYLCFKMITAKVDNKREELLSIDSTILKATNNAKTKTTDNGIDIFSDCLDVEDNFNGLVLTVQSRHPNNDATNDILYRPIKNEYTSMNTVTYTWYLPLAVWNGSSWQTIESVDNTTGNRWNNLTLSASHILVEPKSNAEKVAQQYENPQDLLT